MLPFKLVTRHVLLVHSHGEFYSNQSTSEATVIEDELLLDNHCFSLTNIWRTRRLFDLLASGIGICLNAIHLSILIYIKVVRKAKSVELLFSQGILAMLTLLFLFIGCTIDLCWVGISYSATWFRAHVWLFLVNSLMAAYGFLIVALCIDRYVALNRPIYYRHTFTRKRVRFGLIASSCFLGLFMSTRWIVFNSVVGVNDIRENVALTRTWKYNMWRLVVYVEGYLFAGIAMLTLSFANIRKLHEIKKAYKDEKLGMSGQLKDEWMKNHATIAKICVILAISYVTFNWPYCIVDYMYTDELADTDWYGFLTLVINLMQIAYIQLNFFFFAFCSRLYRATIMSIVRWPYESITRIWQLVKGRSMGLAKLRDQRESTNTNTTLFTIC